MSKICLGKTYICKNGSEFTPIKYIQGDFKPYRSMGNPNAVNQRIESRYMDINGDIRKKSTLKTLKE